MRGSHNSVNSSAAARTSSRRAFLLRAGCSVVLGAWSAAAGFACGRGTSPPARTTRREPPGAAPQPAESARAIDQRPPLPATEPIVRVRIARIRSQGITEADAENGDNERGEGILRVGEENQLFRVTQDGARPFITSVQGPLEISLDSRGWSILDGRFYRVPLVNLDPVGIRLAPGMDAAGSEDASLTSTIALGDRRYGGTLHLVPRTDMDPGAIDVVNHIALEQYLPGVLARELFNHWHLQTHAAQAVAARSFACAEHAYFRKRRHFDMVATQTSQVYIGAVTHQRSLDAVAMTRGTVLAEDDLLVPGYYSSCCGGVAARAVDAIGPSPINDTPSLHGHQGGCPCDGAPVFEWTIERNGQEVLRRLIAFGQANRHPELPKLVTLASVEPRAFNEHGRPTRYLISDTRDLTINLPAETLRRAVNHAGQGLGRPERPLRSSNFAVEVNGNTITFRGRGFGHGAGMCQYGAESLARAGQDYRAILEFYYPGAKIVTAHF